MRRTVPIVLTAAVAATTFAAPSAAAPVAAATTTRIIASGIGVKTVAYGAHKRQRMDIYTPAWAVGKVGKRLGTVVLVHGGAWVKGDKADFAPQARQLARMGYVVANINYRFAQEAAWPAQRNDTVKSVEYLRSRARTLNVDKSRIVLVGSSAGAHLATAAATYGRGKDLVSGLIALSAPLGMRRIAGDPAHNLDGIVMNQLLRCTPAQCGVRYDAASPKFQLSPGDPPSLMVVSPGDFVNPRHSIAFVYAAHRVGLSAKLLRIPGDQHGRYLWDEAWPTIRTWLGQRMMR